VNRIGAVRGRRRPIVVAVVALVVAVGAGGAAGRPAASDDAVIAYQGAGTIYLIHADGTDRRPLVSGSSDLPLAWSPDGSRLAFTAGKVRSHGSIGQTSIRIVSADGTNGRLLTRAPSHTAQWPTWSPDGRRIAFIARSSSEDRNRLYVIRADGTGLHTLGPAPASHANDWSPDWSPDGRWILFERIGVGPSRNALMAIRPDGTGVRRIATLIAGPQFICPDWSPDGSKIAYQASTSVATRNFPEIWVMNADGTGRTRLTHDPSRDENPDWSPDGTRIAFYSERFSKAGAEIFVMDAADGGNVVRVTRDPWYSSLPRWKPAP
jgi:Tol biopolymer transport system component